MNLQELDALIGTMKVGDSKVSDFIGRNCRCPSLVPGTLYILKEWTIKHHVNYDNPFIVAEFIGSGREDDGVRTLFAENPSIKTMNDGDYYFFRAWDKKSNESYEFGAYMFENCICITSSAVRITCFAINGHESEGFDTTTKEAKPARIPATPRTSAGNAIPTRASKSNVPDIDREDIVIDEDDDGEGCPGAVEVHPISLIPFRQKGGARARA